MRQPPSRRPPAAYLAGPEVFLPDAAEIGRRKKELCRRHGFEGLYPLDAPAPRPPAGGPFPRPGRFRGMPAPARGGPRRHLTESMYHREKTAMPTVDYFLKIEGIPGESTDIKHPNEIAVEAWSFGESDPGADTGASGAGAGKVALRDFHFAAAVSKASPRLIAACAEGQRLKSAVLTCRKSAGLQIEFPVLKFPDGRATAYETGPPGSRGVMPR